MRFFFLKKRTNRDQPEDDLFPFANHEQFLSTITAHLVIWDNFVDKYDNYTLEKTPFNGWNTPLPRWTGNINQAVVDK